MSILKKYSRGFTLLEILLVVGIISLLAGIVIVAINPAKQLATVRNTERKSDIKQLNSALTQYYIDEFEFPDTITSSSTEICDTGILSAPSGVSCGSLIDLSVLVPDYITSIPTDPQAVTTNGAGYNVLVSAGKIGLNATLAELDQTITLGIATGTGGGSSTLGDGLVAHYKMNDTNGTTVVDTKGNNGTGTYTPADGHVGTGAISLNGESDCIDIPNFPNSTEDFSVSLWFKGTQMISALRYQTSGATSWWAFYEDGSTNPSIYFTDSSDSYIVGFGSPSEVEDGNWHLLTATFKSSDGAGAKTYLDGSLIDSHATETRTTDTTKSLQIGCYQPGNQHTAGYLDDVRVYNRALTGSDSDCTSDPDNEICDIYNGGDGTEAE
jgi:prepilin-type N-terminal cleavage/methylation domain-containing protein